MKKKYWIICGLILLVLDYFTKLYIHRNFELGESVSIIGDFLRLTYVRNPGIAFGMFQESGWFLSYLIPVAILILLLIFYKTENKNLLVKLAFLWIITGALGNFMDRMLYGYVVDFVDIDFFHIKVNPFVIAGFEFGGYELDRWPAFNLADSLISCGVALLCADAILNNEKNDSTDKAGDTEKTENASCIN